MIGRWQGIVIGLLGSTGVMATNPVPFVENKNQWAQEFHFGGEFPQVRMMLKDASIYFLQHQSVPDDSKIDKLPTYGFDETLHHGTGTTAYTSFELVFHQALQPRLEARNKRKTIYNYFLGEDPSRWAEAARSFGEVWYRNVYRGIDLKVYSEDGLPKYDWVVAPCGDPRQVRFSYKGVRAVTIRNEELVIENAFGEVVETKPYAYQVVNGVRRTVPAAFEIDNDEVQFVFPSGYDPNYELVIDPFLIFSSYSGSTLDNWGNAATPDNHGNLYSGGMVSGPVQGLQYPTTPGAYQTVHHGGTWDVGILKYDSVGFDVLYVTYLGGNGAETPQSLVVNKNNELLILGATSSNNFPGAKGAFKGGFFVDPLHGVQYNGGTDLFIARLSEDGSKLLASTYLGGSSNDGINFVSGSMGTNDKFESPLARNYGDQLRGDIITDDAGFVFIASNTRSSDFPVVNNPDPDALFHGGTHDGLIAKLDPSLNLVWSRLIGGAGTDVAYSIKFNASGNVLVGGGTTSTNINGFNGLHAVAPGGTDGWIAEFQSDGQAIVRGTYIGTAAYDQVYFIDVATNGDILCYGQTQGNYPITPIDKVFSNPGAGQFLHRLTPTLSTTVFSTVFGKGGLSPDISPTAFLVNACDNIYMAGWGGIINAPQRGGILRNYVGGNTLGLPVTSDAWQPQSISGQDFYLIVLTGDGQQMVYATFLGGVSSPTHVDGGTSRFDKRGIVYHAVCAGCGGFPSDFPSYHVPSARATNRSANCNNAAFKFDLSSLRAGIQTNNIQLNSPGITRVCMPEGYSFQNTSVGGEIFEWQFGDGDALTVISKNPIPHYYKKPGRYIVKLKSIDKSTCIGVDSTFVAVEVFDPHLNAGPDQKICFGSSTRLTATGGTKYVWRSADGSFSSVEPSPSVAPQQKTDYFVTITDDGGCTRKDTVTIDVVPGIDLAFNFERVYDCTSRPFIKVENTSKLKAGEEARLFFGDGTSTDELTALHTYQQDGVYTLTLQATKEFCTYQASQETRIVTLNVPNVITPAEEDGLNDTFRVQYASVSQAKAGLTVGVKIMNRWGVQVFQSNDYKDDWNGRDVDGGIYYYEVEIVGEIQCKGWIHLVK